MNTTFLIFYLIILVIAISGMWKVYEKAGEAGWKSIIPIYNLIVLMRIVRKPAWWVILMMIPYLGFIWTIWSYNRLSKSFGRGVGCTLGLFFLPFIFFPILGFGEAQYQALEDDDSEDNLAESFNDSIDELKDVASEVREETASFADQAEEVLTDAKEEVASLMDDEDKKS